MNGDLINRLLNGPRMLVGLGSIAAPHQAFRGAGLDTGKNPQLPFMTRMFGVRDLALGAGALTTSGDERRRWLQMAVMADAIDATAAIAGVRAGYLEPRTGAVMAVTAIGATALGIVALASD
ncbi:MAG: hypothetical protein M3340_04730 [Actinomycetota bacterium]|nr:hypothetical protein [Actinomycetota bacterium]